MELKPLDIVCVHGLRYNMAHLMIKWRSLDNIVHCFTLKDEDGYGYNPLFSGMEIDHISKYSGRYVTICRHKYIQEGKIKTILDWCESKYKLSKKYDFINQWLFGFILGFTSKSLVNNENAWTCSEFPYWMFQDNGVSITSVEESLPLPRLFKYHNDFEIIFEGKLP